MADEKAEPLLQQNGPEDCKQTSCRYLRYCGLLSVLIAGVILLCCWICQGIVYAVAMHGCSESALEGYEYPSGDGPAEDEVGYNHKNALPKNEMFQYHDGWPSDSFDVTRATQFGDGGIGKVGTWYRYGGPLFTSYVFMDVPSGQSTIWMRRNLLRMGMSHRIARCDGKGPYIEVYEGSNYFMNRMRKNSLFQWLAGKGTDYTFKISVDGVHVADSLQSTTSGIPSISFAALDHSHVFASGGQDTESLMWTIQNDFEYQSRKEIQPLPYWATGGVTTLFAFHKSYTDAKKESKAHDHDDFLQAPVAPVLSDFVTQQKSDAAPDGANVPASAKPASAVDAAIPEAAAAATAEKQPAADEAAAAADETQPAAVAVAETVEKQATQAEAEQPSEAKAPISGPADTKPAARAAASGEIEVKSVAAGSPAAEVQFT